MPANSGNRPGPPRRHPFASASHSSSSMTLTPRSAAFSPRPRARPGDQQVGLGRNRPATIGPTRLGPRLGLARVIFSSVPVKTMVLPAMGWRWRAWAARRCAIARKRGRWRHARGQKESTGTAPLPGPTPSAAIRSDQASLAADEGSIPQSPRGTRLGDAGAAACGAAALGLRRVIGGAMGQRGGTPASSACSSACQVWKCCARSWRRPADMAGSPARTATAPA